MTTSKLFLCNSDLLLEDDPLVTPVEVDCLTFVREKLQSNLAYFYHPFFGNPKITKWPKSTDLACLHCCECFSNSPIPSVRRYDELKNLYYVYGIFCSVNCAKSYLIEHEVAISTMRLLYFNHMIRNVYNIHEAVKPAPPRIRLKRFGGDLTIEQFRNNFTTVTSQTVEHPFVQTSLLCEERSEPAANLLDGPSSCSILPQTLSTTSATSSQTLSSTQNGLYSQFLEKKITETHTEIQEEPPVKKKRKKPKQAKDNADQKKGGLDAFLTFK